MQVNPFKKYPDHKKLLDKLFKNVEKNQNYNILDAGSGRTSLYYLTKFFPKNKITAIV